MRIVQDCPAGPDPNCPVCRGEGWVGEESGRPWSQCPDEAGARAFLQAVKDDPEEPYLVTSLDGSAVEPKDRTHEPDAFKASAPLVLIDGNFDLMVALRAAFAVRDEAGAPCPRCQPEAAKRMEEWPHVDFFDQSTHRPMPERWIRSLPDGQMMYIYYDPDE